MADHMICKPVVGGDALGVGDTLCECGIAFWSQTQHIVSACENANLDFVLVFCQFKKSQIFSMVLVQSKALSCVV